MTPWQKSIFWRLAVIYLALRVFDSKGFWWPTNVVTGVVTLWCLGCAITNFANGFRTGIRETAADRGPI
jgi:hypothetical protein